MTLDERNFNSRTSCEVRLAWKRYRQGKAEFQLTHLLRGATVATQNAIAMTAISTHAPLARCDTGWGAHQAEGIHFNSRTSCEVRRPNTLTTIRRRRFQLTHLLRGATGQTAARADRPTVDFNSRTSCEVRPVPVPALSCTSDFNSRTSCEVRRKREHSIADRETISTHAPLARCDMNRLWTLIPPRPFQLTHLLRGATAIYCSTFISQTHHLVRGGQVNQIIDLSGVKYCPVLARTGNDFCIIHGSLKHYKIIGPSGS